MFKKDTHSPWLDIAVFAVMVGFFLFSAARLLNKNSAEVQQEKAAVIPEAEAVAIPANFQEERAPASEGKNAVTEIQLPCIKSDTYKQSTDADFIRISGSACSQKKIKVTAGHGRNLSNGSEILCFVDRDSDRVSTNYFQLSPGLNKVELDLVWSNGAKRRSLVEIQKLIE